MSLEEMPLEAGGLRSPLPAPLPLVAAGLLAVAVVVFLGLSGSLGPAGGLAGGRAPQLAPTFAAATFDGAEVSLADFRGRPVVLTFWASWCPPCRAEAPALERTWRTYQGRGVAFLGVNIQDTEAAARLFLREFGITYPSVRDATNEIATRYAVRGIPTTVFIDGDGYVQEFTVGGLTEQHLVARVEELLRQPPPQ